MVKITQIPVDNLLNSSSLYNRTMKRKQIDFSKPPEKIFSISLVVRDIDGNPRGRKEFSSDNAYDIYMAWQRTSAHHLKNRRKKKEKLPSAEQAEKILKEIQKEGNS